ncbi:MAG: hypothetical protein ACOX87_13575, partial [Chloroflexota bacterium]
GVTQATALHCAFNIVPVRGLDFAGEDYHPMASFTDTWYSQADHISIGLPPPQAPLTISVVARQAGF